ncbi:glutamate racemase [Zongyangia hominis]|uniref:Glutamate racemase n=1 Tax=Zongyangia hominis TaxID=2763677 RepID=A0A926EEI1_9FIRM|nr:glutamate racemase [Zongyangia hominis]MBC8570979.1 glutamate racemase [Zongyangia hominis]
MDKRPIGVFDSGLGGLTVVKELRKILPGEDIIYFGDTGRVPYGTRSRETIRRYAAQDIHFLCSHDVKMVVAACGTVSSVLTDKDVQDIGVPYTGVVRPAAQEAASLSQNGKIGVIGTTATVHSGAYGKAIRGIRPDAAVVGRDCPLFVPLVENGQVGRDNEITRLTAKMYLEPFFKENIDTLILGCTHYPIIYDIIADVMQYAVVFVDPGQVTARYVSSYLMQNGLSSEKAQGGTCHYYVSDQLDTFADVAGIFLGENVDGKVEYVSVDTL